MQLSLRVVLGVIGVTILLRLPMDGFAQQSTSVKDRGAAQATVPAFPKDVDPGSGFRLPLLKRDDLDDGDVGIAGEKLGFDKGDLAVTALDQDCHTRSSKSLHKSKYMARRGES